MDDNPAMRSVLVVVVGLGCVARHGELPARPVPLLAHVPSDTPYFYGSLAAAPPELVTALLHILKSAPVDGAISKVILAAVEELGDFSAARLDAVGIGAQPVGVLYGLGLYPVMRWRVADAARVRALVDRIAERTGARRAGGRFYTVAEDDDELVFGVAAGELVGAIVPTAREHQVLADELPARALTEADVDEVAAAHEVSKLGIGWVDFRRILPEVPGLGEDCVHDLGALAAAAPRVVFGVSRVDATEVDGNVDLELSPAALAAIQTLGVSLPPVPQAPGAVVVASAGIDLAKAHALLAASTFSCDALEDLRAGLLGMTAMPGVLGLQLSVDRLEFSSLPPRMTGFLVVTATDPRALLGAAALLDPAFSNTQLADDGKAVTAKLRAVNGSISLALRGENVGLSLGDGMASRLEHVVSAPLAPAPFLRWRSDTPRMEAAMMAADARYKFDRRSLEPGWWWGENRLELGATPRGLRLHVEQELNTDLPAGVVPLAVEDELLPPGEPFRVKVLDAGAEPRALLRYDLPKGSVTELDEQMDTDGHAIVGKAAPRDSKVSMTRHVSILATDPGHVEVTVTKLVWNGADQPVGKLEADVAPDGALTNVTEGPRGPTAFDTSVVLLPDVPVGKNARWQVVTATEYNTMKIETYTLRSREADRLELDETHAQSYVTPVFALPNGQTGRIASYVFNASGHVTILTSMLVPSSSELSISQSLKGTLSGAEVELDSGTTIRTSARADP
jgi:hypothetical protein